MSDKLPQNVETALEFAEDFITAYCIDQNVSAALIFRDSRGNDTRRVFGPNGPRDIPAEFDDAMVLARLGMVQHATPEDLLAMDAAIATALAQGDRVVIL